MWRKLATGADQTFENQILVIVKRFSEFIFHISQNVSYQIMLKYFV